MDVKLTDKAKAALKEMNTDSFKIEVVGDGWAGPVFGLVQGEPTEYDSVINADGMKFAVESIYDDVIDYFDVDYYQGVFRKGFVVYANGARGC